MASLDPNLLLLVKSSSLGDGELDLGEKLMRSFLSMVVESGRVPARCVFMSSGVFLTTEGSPVLELLHELEAGGAEILSCGTCLDYYSRKDKLAIGKPTNMRDTVDAMLTFSRVLSP